MKKLTKSDFMKDAKFGKLKLTLIGGKNYVWLKEKRPASLSPRAIVKVQTNAVYLEGPENNGQGSYLEIPPASLMEYAGEGNSLTLSIYLPGTRNMTPEEKRNVQNAEAERAEYEKKNPYSDSFWHMNNWYRNCSTPWIYFGSGTVKGKRAGQGDNYGKIVDNALKGELLLKYTVTNDVLEEGGRYEQSR